MSDEKFWSAFEGVQQICIRWMFARVHVKADFDKSDLQGREHDEESYVNGEIEYRAKFLACNNE